MIYFAAIGHVNVEQNEKRSKFFKKVSSVVLYFSFKNMGPVSIIFQIYKWLVIIEVISEYEANIVGFLEPQFEFFIACLYSEF